MAPASAGCPRRECKPPRLCSKFLSDIGVRGTDARSNLGRNAL